MLPLSPFTFAVLAAGLLSPVDAGPLLPRYATSAEVSVPLLPPSNTSKYIDSAFGSFSIELAYWTEFWGTREQPNEFSRKLLQNLIARTGKAPIIRIGGVSQDSSIYDPNANVSIHRDLSLTGAIYRTTYGPGFFDTFSSFPEGTKFVVPLNLGNDTYQIALDAAKAAWEQVDHDSIWAFSLGNESGNYKLNGTLRENTTWNEAVYVKQWSNWTDAIDSALGLPQPAWWGGDDGTTADLNTPAIQPRRIIAQGINNRSTVKEFNVHAYQYSTCRPASAVAATAANLINHRNISAFIDVMGSNRIASEEAGVDFVVGEYNAVSCSGRPNLTDTFADALWVLDVSLYQAASNITRAHLHMGATLASQSATQVNVVGQNGTAGFSTYDLWYPIDSPLRGVHRANPSYLAYLFLTEAISTSGLSRIAELPTPPNLSRDTFAAYAVWDDKHSTEHPSRLAFINFQAFNQSSPYTNTSVSLDISEFLAEAGCKDKEIKLKRMTAPGADTLSSQQSTWGGQSWSNGTGDGAKSLELVLDGKVGLRGSEAVLVLLEGKFKW